ncbi:hypothetical protein FQR65_LT08167 [Abscondita terminalis]|nr:hypothetical protein FQR65_LT08167 [Abscondita terminalis]
MDTTSNGHNTKTWTQRRNELLDISPKLGISPNFLIGRNVENGHNAEKQKLALYDRKSGVTAEVVIVVIGHNAEISYWTNAKNCDTYTADKNEEGCNAKYTWHVAITPPGSPSINSDFMFFLANIINGGMYAPEASMKCNNPDRLTPSAACEGKHIFPLSSVSAKDVDGLTIEECNSLSCVLMYIDDRE